MPALGPGTLSSSKPTADTLTALHTAPANGSVIAAINFCNAADTEDTLYVTYAPGGAADAPTHLLYRGKCAAFANGGVFWDFGLSLASGDVIRCYSLGGNIVFHAFGSNT